MKRNLRESLIDLDIAFDQLQTDLRDDNTTKYNHYFKTIEKHLRRIENRLNEIESLVSYPKE